MTMRDYTGVDVKALPGSLRVMKRNIPVSVAFAPEPGTLKTLEGCVRYERGDALMTGVQGERWPIPQTAFLPVYAAVPPTRPGENGTYSKRPIPAWAVRLAENARVTIAGGELTGKPGDWLVQYGKNNYGIVAAAVFSETYTIISEDK